MTALNRDLQAVLIVGDQPTAVEPSNINP